jgi:hypothetical protein
MAMRRAKNVLSFCAALVAVTFAVIPVVQGLNCSSWTNPSLPYCVELSSNVVTQWSISNDTITLNHTVQTPGVSFLALGLSETGSMKGADMFVLTGPAPQWTLTDRFSEGFYAPEIDAHQDLALHGVHHVPTSGILSVAFSRKLAPCDTRDLPIRRGEKVYLLYAYGRDFGYHGRNRGSSVVELYPAAVPLPGAAATATATTARPSLLVGSSASETTTPPSPAASDPGSYIFNFSMAPVEIPGQETTYMYQFFKLPTDK